ncbi:hypothetical protein LJC63_05675 [Ruminococcaceae bacterium OttesenSCG-928-L11]|nr:hypothetical protein [Ruminococcaceae bacterium OttesenSCG-928-L11]
MRKYMVRYLIFWLPAVLVACFYNNPTSLSHGLQWIFAILMLLGWTVNTAMASYHFPRRTLSLILMYLGINMIAALLLYSIDYTLPILRLAGILSFTPLDILIVALLDFTIPHELYMVGLVVGLAVLGWAAGLLYRRFHPNPYRPHFSK